MVCGQASDSQITKNFASTVEAKLLKYYYFCHFTFHEERLMLCEVVYDSRRCKVYFRRLCFAMGWAGFWYEGFQEFQNGAERLHTRVRLGFGGFCSETETSVDRDRKLKCKYGKCRIGRVERSLGGQSLNLFILGHTILALGDPYLTNLDFFVMYALWMRSRESYIQGWGRC